MKMIYITNGGKNIYERTNPRDLSPVKGLPERKRGGLSE